MNKTKIFHKTYLILIYDEKFVHKTQMVAYACSIELRYFYRERLLWFQGAGPDYPEGT